MEAAMGRGEARFRAERLRQARRGANHRAVGQDGHQRDLERMPLSEIGNLKAGETISLQHRGCKGNEVTAVMIWLMRITFCGDRRAIRRRTAGMPGAGGME